jgi:hypothetical protein
MKKLTIVFSIVLFNCSFLYSMERQISWTDRLNSIGGNYVQCKQEYSVDKLPLEVQGIIAKNILNIVGCELRQNFDQKRLDCYIARTPLFLVNKFVSEFVQMQKMCVVPICGKIFLPHLLFCLPKNERDVFIRIANRPWMQGGNIDNADYKIIKKIPQLDLKKGLCLKVLPDDKVIRLCEKIKHIGVIGIAVGVPSMIFCMAPRESLSGQCLSIMSFVGILGGYGLALSADGAIYLYNKFYCDEEVFIKEIRL